MKKAFLLVVVLALALGITYLLLHHGGSNNSKRAERDAPLSIGSKTSAFNRSFNGLLNSYYLLSEGFSAEDTAQISIAVQHLNGSVDSIRFDQFKADSSIILTAINVAQSIKGEILGLIGEKTMEQKKREFNLITEDIYSLIRVVKYDGSVIYHMRCTTAFSDSSDAYWLSATPLILNPYLGKNNPAGKVKITENGEVIDSIHFSAPASE